MDGITWIFVLSLLELLAESILIHLRNKYFWQLADGFLHLELPQGHKRSLISRSIGLASERLFGVTPPLPILLCHVCIQN